MPPQRPRRTNTTHQAFVLANRTEHTSTRRGGGSSPPVLSNANARAVNCPCTVAVLPAGAAVAVPARRPGCWLQRSSGWGGMGCVGGQSGSHPGVRRQGGGIVVVAAAGGAEVSAVGLVSLVQSPAPRGGRPRLRCRSRNRQRQRQGEGARSSVVVPATAGTAKGVPTAPLLLLLPLRWCSRRPRVLPQPTAVVVV
jgi:hypothetical protein